jgi:hypothetical protein
MRNTTGEAVIDLPSAWLIDVDGTLAIRNSRGPYEWRAAGEDTPNRAVVMAVQALALHPDVSTIVAITGRNEAVRRLTTMWLDAQNVPFNELLMRADGDRRPDDVIKEEIFRRDIAPRYDVVGVVDDRDRVVRMWRRLGLVCFQVAEGDF